MERALKIKDLGGENYESRITNYDYNYLPYMKENTSRLLQSLALVLLLAFGLGIRLFDLTDPPLDFHSTRQMLSLSKARGMYYQYRTDLPSEQRKFAIEQWKFAASVEPEFFERIVALTYRFTGEQTWIARVYSSLFWVIAAFFLFLLARELTSANAALASTAVFLFLPYGVGASRAFQPDPLMVSLIVIFWWAVFHWAKEPTSYKWAVIAGIFGGFAIFVKLVAAFFVIAGGLGALLGRESLMQTIRRPQVYLMAALGILPGAAYIIYGIQAGYLGQQFGGRFMPALFLSPAYYLGWAGMLNLVAGGVPILFALLGFYFIRERSAFRFLLGLWIGYFVFGLYFNYHISTHDYYSLPLVPILALSLSPVINHLVESLLQSEIYPRARLIPMLIIVGGLFLILWNLRAELKSNDYRNEPAKWQEISRVVGPDARLTGLVQDYGMRLAYWGGRSMTAWMRQGDFYYHENRGAQFEFESMFADQTAKKDYFIVTDFGELEKQPLLKERLYSQYPIAFSGDGYVIFDLHP
jgi:hypothetical protein